MKNIANFLNSPSTKTKKILLFPICVCFFLETGFSAEAQTQISPDLTLPQNSSVQNIGTVYQITNGTRPNNGINLFHSFSQFTLQSGDTARFLHDSGIQNIITRITGGLPANIDGTIQTLINGSINDKGSANIFFINPNGIIFGANARLDIGGSFLGSTANSIKLADGTEFSATNPVSTPILTVSVPLGLQYGSNPGSIIVNGPGSNLALDPNTFATDRSNRNVGLQVTQGKTLALLGGTINLTGGNLTAEAGRIELWAVANGQLSIVNNNGQLTINSPGTLNYRDINLSQAASVDVSGNGAGIIQSRSQNLSLTDGSAMLANTLGNATGGGLNIKAVNSINVTGSSTNQQFYSGLFTDIAAQATGNGGNLQIETRTLFVTDGAQIAANNFGNGGNSGDLTVKAQDIELNGVFVPGFASGLTTFVFPGVTGNGGNINIETELLRVKDGANISSSTAGIGNAGNLHIKANDIQLGGVSSSGDNSFLLSLVFPGGTGNGGVLSIDTKHILLTDSSQITTATYDAGNAGDLIINANLVELIGASQSSRTGLFASAIVGTGNGGNLKVNANQLLLNDGAIISVSNFQSQNLSPPGTGSAGNIQLNAKLLQLDNGSSITAASNGGNQGNISLQSQQTIMRHGSTLTTNASGKATGGNININTNFLIAPALENSDITANATDNFGGRVIITAKGIFGIKPQLQLTPNSDITATSALGSQFSGVVEIHNPEADPSRGVAELPQNLIDPNTQIATSCDKSKANEFVLTGRGGLPEDATQSLRGQSVWQDLRLADSSKTAQLPAKIFTKSPLLPSSSPDSRLIEAQGWVVNAQGKIELLAEAVNVSPQSSWHQSASCPRQARDYHTNSQIAIAKKYY